MRCPTEMIYELINDLAPLTRRDSWWTTDGPFEIIKKHFEYVENYERTKIAPVNYLDQKKLPSVPWPPSHSQAPAVSFQYEYP